MSIRLMIIIGCAAALCALMHGTAAAREEPSTVLHQQAAIAMLRAVGVRTVSSGGCTDRWNPHCTSLEGVRLRTVGGLLELRDDSGCPIVVSGGTEAGHATGALSHGAGYKLDVLPNRCLNAYIRRSFPPIRTRGDGARLYQGPDRATYAREPSHWDITFI